MMQTTELPLQGARRSVRGPQALTDGALVWAWLLCLALLWPGATWASGAKRCPQVDAVVMGAVPADLADICHGVAATAAFFAAHGVFPIETWSITVTPRLPTGAGPSAAGCYIEQEHRGYLVPYATLRQQKNWFGVAITRGMYRALASHEAAHAIVSCHFKIPRPSIQAKEYLAYVAMLSGMDSGLRTKVLSKMKPTGFDSLDRFTPLLLLFDPMRFGAEAYQHFSTTPDPGGLIQAILSGAALTD